MKMEISYNKFKEMTKRFVKEQYEGSFSEGDEDLERQKKMAEQWRREGRAFSHNENDDTKFFKMIGKDMDEVRIDSENGSNIIYREI